jgi:hypothetical protein
MGSGGGYYKNWSEKQGVDVSDVFLEDKDGKQWIRPEGAAAAYLITPQGKQLVKDVAAGNATEAQIKDMFLFVGVGRENSKAEYVAKTLAAGGIDNMTKLFNENKGSDFDELYNGAIGNLEGIGEGKTGFFNQYFGVSNRGVIDARQLNAWISGSMKLNEEQTKLKKKVEGSEKLGKELLDRIQAVGEALGYPKDLAGYIAHHAIWDGVNGSITTHKGEYEVINSKSQRLAPNGKPSKLNEKQYEQVRTPAFKKWFGDWENDPDNASKVVDENGEPLVVYHGGTLNEIDRGIDTYTGKYGIYFTKSRKKASNYMEATIRGKREKQYKGEPNVFETFLDIKNPLPKSVWSKFKFGADGINDKEYSKIEEYNADGIIDKGAEIFNLFKGTTQFVVFDMSQIKSATDNTGEFSTESLNIKSQKARNLDTGVEYNKSENITSLKKAINNGLGKEIKLSKNDVKALSGLELTVFSPSTVENVNTNVPIIIIKKRGHPWDTVAEAVKYLNSSDSDSYDTLSDYFEIVDGRHRIKKAISNDTGLSAIVVTEMDYEKYTSTQLFSDRANTRQVQEAIDYVYDNIAEVDTLEEAIDALKEDSQKLKTGRYLNEENAAYLETLTEESMFRNYEEGNTQSTFAKATDLFYQIRETEGAAKKKRLADERKALMDANPSVKYIDDNIKNILDQLEKNNKATRKGNCP